MHMVRNTSGNESAYVRHRPEQTLIYQIIDKYYIEFINLMEMQSKSLPRYVQREFTEYLKCGWLEHGFLRVQCESCHVEHLVAFSCKRHGFCPSCGFRRMAESAALLVFDMDCYYCQRLHKEISEYNRLGIEVCYLAFPRQGLKSPSYDKSVTVTS